MPSSDHHVYITFSVDVRHTFCVILDMGCTKELY